MSHLDWCITGVQRYQLIISLFMLLLLLLTSGKSCQSCQKQRAGDEMAKASKALKAVKSWEKLVSITELKPSMLGLVLPFVMFSLDVDCQGKKCRMILHNLQFQDTNSELDWVAVIILWNQRNVCSGTRLLQVGVFILNKTFFLLGLFSQRGFLYWNFLLIESLSFGPYLLLEPFLWAFLGDFLLRQISFIGTLLTGIFTF